MNQQIIMLGSIEQKIFTVRNIKVMIDADLAEIYGVSTKRLNEQVKRNKERFPEDFMFQLTKEEKIEVVANCDHLEKLKFSTSLPYAFTEHGAIMLASVLNTPIAVQTSILIVRAFIKLREIMSTHKELVYKLNELESKFEKHDKDIQLIFEAIRQLMMPPDKPKRKIGFIADE
ncbi:MAG: ORF6N domain-containing protein [Actinobacteria bacterium]|nr:ORF6N domain-containing protein [Actinomycetota bacterium]